MGKENKQPKLKFCHDCAVGPGMPHRDGCDVEMCSVCGGQRLQCDCIGHDKLFARWTGIWPGYAEAQELGLDLNNFIIEGYHEIFFIKPTEEDLSKEDNETKVSFDCKDAGELFRLLYDSILKLTSGQEILTHQVCLLVDGNPWESRIKVRDELRELSIELNDNFKKISKILIKEIDE